MYQKVPFKILRIYILSTIGTCYRHAWLNARTPTNVPIIIVMKWSILSANVQLTATVKYICIVVHYTYMYV